MARAASVALEVFSMCFRSRAAAAVAVFVLFVGSASAVQAAPVSAPSAASSQLAGLWRAAKVELIACIVHRPNALTLLLRSARLAPTTSLVAILGCFLIVWLALGMTALNTVLQRESGSSGSRAYSMGLALFSRLAAAPSSRFVRLDSYGEDACKQNCDRVFVALALVRSAPCCLSRFCVSVGRLEVTSIAWSWCDSEQSSANVVAAGPGPDTRSGGLCDGGLCEFSVVFLVPSTPSAAQLAGAVPKLSGRFSGSELRAALASVDAVLGAQ